MDKNQKIGLSLVVAVALLALFIAYIYKDRTQDKTAVLPLPVATSGFATSTSTPTSTNKTTTKPSASRVYSSTNIMFTSSLDLTVNVNSAKQFIASIQNADKKASFVMVLFDEKGECFLGECQKPAQSSENINGIQWDFLGNPEYCSTPDNCSQPSTLYRTMQNGRPVYLAFYAYGPKLDQDSILRSLRFK